MKHLTTISRVQVSSAQSSPTEIITIIVSVLSAVGTLLGVILPVLGDKEKSR